MSLTAEIIAVGDELLRGSIVNTNAQAISLALAPLGIDVRWHTVVGDHPTPLRDALEIAKNRADILITTGGLGPTYDDLTKQTIAAAFDRKLVFYPDILEHIRSFFENSLHIAMPENNRQQAELPEGCTVFDNPVGTAPGCAFAANGVHVLMLPGPPVEMQPMLEHWVVPYLETLMDGVSVSHDLMTFGIGESSVDQLLHEKLTYGENPVIATYAKPAEVRIRITANAATTDGAEVLLSPVLEQVCALLGDYVYGIDIPSLEVRCMQLLKEKGLTFATAESCTGGQIAQRITALPGSSAVFRGGVVSYWSSVKYAVLGVPQELLDQYGAVSEQVARAMAEGAKRITGADLAVSATGVAGPDKDERGVDVGIVYIGLATPHGVFCRKMDVGMQRRDRIQGLAANHAFDLIRRYLTDLTI